MIFISGISTRTNLSLKCGKLHVYAPLELQPMFLKVPNCTISLIPEEFKREGLLNIKEKLELLQYHLRNQGNEVGYYFCIDPEFVDDTGIDERKLHLFDEHILVHPQIVGGSREAILKATADHLYDDSTRIMWPYACRLQDIIKHLSSGSKLPFPFPPYPNLHVEIRCQHQQHELLTRSSRDYGYTRSTQGQYTLILSHCNAFFTTNARALIHQFERWEVDVIVGGTSSTKEGDYLRSIAKGPFWYPDGRFILGKTEVVNRLLQLLEHSDLATIIERKTFPIHIDYNQEFFYALNGQNHPSILAPMVYHTSNQKSKELHDLYINTNDDYCVPASSTVVWTVIVIFIFLVVYIMFILALSGKYSLDDLYL